MYNNDFEKAPGSVETQGERSVPPEQDFVESFAKGVPEFAGKQFGIANEKNQFYGETTDEEESESDDKNEGLTDAAAVINYGLDVIAREKGVEQVVQGIKTFDASGSENPLRDLYTHLGLKNLDDFKDARDEAVATRRIRNTFRDEYNMPRTQRRSREGALKAIEDMKELIAEVEGADPRYAELRNAAKSAEKGYFEYAVKDYGTRGLTELFTTLTKQKESKESPDTDQPEEETPKPEEEQIKKTETGPIEIK